MNCKDIVAVVIIDFRDTDGNDLMKEQIQEDIISGEMERIENDLELKHLHNENRLKQAIASLSGVLY